MQTPSEEQQYIIDNIHSCKNVVVDACAGSGKSTTVLSCANSLKDKTFLQMTYNKQLREEVKEIVKKQNIDNIQVHTYHSFAVKYYLPSAFDDTSLRKILRENIPPIQKIPPIDILVLDECQDMTSIFFKLMVKVMMDIGHSFQLLILGDKRQGLYEFKGSYIGFLTFASNMWESHPLLLSNDFIYCSLNTSYRITEPMAKFVNEAMLGENRLISNKIGIPVKYYRRSINFLISIVIEQIQLLLKNGNTYGDIFILGSSLKNKTIRKIENKLVELNIPCYISLKENQDKLDNRVIDNKIVFSTFHSVKGRQRKHVFVIGFDSNYMEYYDRDTPKHVCPNTLYVACTRATHCLYLFESEQKDTRPLPFLKISHIEMKLKEYVDFIGQPMTIAPVSEKKKENDINKTEKFTVSSLVTFVPEFVLDIICPIIDRIFVLEKPKESETIDIPSVIETKSGYEDVSNLNGTAIPIMFYDYLRKENSTNTLQRIIHNDIQKFDPDEHIFLKNIVKNMPEKCSKNSDYLYLANIALAIEEELYSKIKQIGKDDYGWLTEEVIDTCYDRLDAVVGEECRNGKWFPEKTIIHSSCDEDHFEIDQCLSAFFPKENKYRFTARIDLDTENNVWELKCTSQINIEHMMQTVVYAWLYKMVYNNNKNFRLFNIKTGELWKIDAEIEDLTTIVVALIRGKCHKIDKKTDVEYIEESKQFISSLLLK